jgi:phage terminase large subunit GpA-like protein
MIPSDIKEELLDVYRKSIQPPYFGGIRQWSEENIILPPAYAIPGKLDLSISPYLLEPMKDIDDPSIMQINLAMATQVGKSLVSELAILYWIVNNPGPIFRIFNNNEISATFAETRLIPLLKNCKVIKPLLDTDRFSMKKAGIILPHMAVTMGGANEGKAHGMSVKYLLMDELHQWEVGMYNKFMARTTAFAGRRKIICASQPSSVGSEWDTIYSKGLIYEWQWLCPTCNKRQPYIWSKEKKGGGYAGFNWDTVLNTDGSTNIVESSFTTWLECMDCDCRIHDTPTERRYLNDTGKYVCIKSDGDAAIKSYTCPNFVNINLSFESAATQYMIAKKMMKYTGLSEQMEIFVTQVLGKFYKKDEILDISKIITEFYDKSVDKEWVVSMGVDVQRIGSVKYYVVRAWNKNGNESRRLAFGVTISWDEIEEIRKKHNVLLPMVHVDSGDGETMIEVYQECLKRGQVIKVNGNLQYISYTPTKGDGNKSSYKHGDNITRLFAPISNQDAGFPQGHKLKGIPAPLVLFSNYSIKTILGNLRDNQIPNVTWKIDVADDQYDKQMYSEGLFDVVDKKSGMTVKRWVQTRQDNHFFDCEVLNLMAAIRANVFSATKIDEADIMSAADIASER